MSDPLRRLLLKCLEIDPLKRDWPESLLQDDTIFGLIKDDNNTEKSSVCPTGYYASKFLRSSQLHSLILNNSEIAALNLNNEKDFDEVLALPAVNPLTDRNLHEVYYLWQRAGGDVMGELKRQGLTRKKPAVLSLPQ